MSRLPARLSALSNSALLPWLSLGGRLVGAAVFGWAALSKIGDPAATARAVRAFKLLPEALVGPVAHGLPAVELVLAVLLLAGIATRAAGLVADAALAVFIGAITSAGIRGLRIDCGCFGGGGTVAHTQYLLDITRDSLLLALLATIPIARSSRWSVDRWLDRRAETRRPGTKRERLAAARAAAAAATRRRQRLIASGVAAACLAGAAIGGNVAAAAGATAAPMAIPAGATASGGIWVGSPNAPTALVAYEDPQCPICGQFEKTNGSTLESAVTAGQVKVEYRMRSFLGPESVRADNALAAAQNDGKFEALRQALYANQPEEHTGGFTTSTLLRLGRSVGLDDAAFVNAVEHLTYERWVDFVDVQASKDGNVGTPQILIAGGQALSQQQTFDPTAFKAAIGIT
jgi:protein-disulfide isomerase